MKPLSSTSFQYRDRASFADNILGPYVLWLGNFINTTLATSKSTLSVIVDIGRIGRSGVRDPTAEPKWGFRHGRLAR